MRQKYEAIVIGTSAGGLHALISIVQQLPSTYPLPIIVVQHRSKDQRNLLEEILQSKSNIKIKQVDEKEKICEGCVYVAPPDYHLLVERDRTFSLSADEQVRYSRPSIDVLFESAAVVYGPALVGIVLTGANSDGANGIEMIGRYGGLTIAQDPEEADFPFMPKASIETSSVKHVWKLSEINHFLLKIQD